MKKYLILALSFFIFSCKVVVYDTPCLQDEDNKLYSIKEMLVGANIKGGAAHLVYADKERGVFLFRGKTPIFEDKKGVRKFAYNELLAQIKSGAAKANVTLPEKFQLVDYSLLNHFEGDLNIEKEFFEKNPRLGKFKNWPMVLISPTQIDQKLQEFDRILKDPRTRNQVWYVHCEGGCNRTGIFMSSYRMAFGGMTFNQANKVGIEECGKKQRDSSFFITKQYCKYLKRHKRTLSCWYD